MLPLEDRIKNAASAGPEELWGIIRDPHPAVLESAVTNGNLNEAMAVFMAKTGTASAETLNLLVSDLRFRDSYRLKAAVSRNPKTPQRATLTLLKHLRIFDLCALAKDPHTNIMIRRKAEQVISEKIPSLPSGVKIALAKRTGGNIVMTILETSVDEKVVSACLDSPSLTEGHLLRIISGTRAGEGVIRRIAGHGKWSLRYSIKYALIRNFYTSMLHVEDFLVSMKTADLRDLYADPGLPNASKPFIFRELSARREVVERKEKTFPIREGSDIPDNGLGK